MSDNNDSESLVGMDFRGDAAPTAMDPYRDNIISNQQQSVLNELRVDMCYDDLNYLNEHKEVEAMATLVFKEVLKSAPKNPWAHAANYLRDPRTADLIANFAASRDYTTQELLDRDFRTYAISTDMAGAQTGRGWDEEQNEEQDHEQDEEPDQEQIEDQYHGYIEEEQYDKQDERLDEGQLIRTGLPPSVNL